MQARYQCLQCGSEWALVGPHPHQCPKCGHIYIKWLNYEAWYADWRKRDPKAR